MNYSQLSIKSPILIVDDDEDDRYIFDQVFKELAVTDKVLYFSNTAKAMTFLREDPAQPFMIICDINMPFMTGVQAKDRHRSLPEIQKHSIYIFLYLY